MCWFSASLLKSQRYFITHFIECLVFFLSLSSFSWTLTTCHSGLVGREGLWCGHERHAGHTGSEEDQVFVPGAAGGLWRLSVSLHVARTLWSVSVTSFVHARKRLKVKCTYWPFVLLTFLQVFWTMTALWIMTPAAYAWRRWQWPTLELVTLLVSYVFKFCIWSYLLSIFTFQFYVKSIVGQLHLLVPWAAVIKSLASTNLRKHVSFCCICVAHDISASGFIATADEDRLFSFPQQFDFLIAAFSTRPLLLL